MNLNLVKKNSDITKDRMLSGAAISEIQQHGYGEIFIGEVSQHDCGDSSTNRGVGGSSIGATDKPTSRFGPMNNNHV